MKRMNKLFKTRIPLAFIVCSVLLASCTKKYDEINRDRNAIATVGPAELPFLFAKAEATALPNIWNYQIAQNLFADQYAQYFACTATYFPSDRLNIRMDWVGAAFNPIYTDLVPQLQSIFAASETNSPEYALAQIVWVLGFHRVTDYWVLSLTLMRGYLAIQLLTIHRIRYMPTSLVNSILRLLY